MLDLIGYLISTAYLTQFFSEIIFCECCVKLLGQYSNFTSPDEGWRASVSLRSFHGPMRGTHLSLEWGEALCSISSDLTQEWTKKRIWIFEFLALWYCSFRTFFPLAPRIHVAGRMVVGKGANFNATFNFHHTCHENSRGLDESQDKPEFDVARIT